MKLIELSEKEFTNFASKHKYANFMQTVEMYNFKKESNPNNYLLGLTDGDKIIAATSIYGTKGFMGKYNFYAPRGFLIDYNDKNLLTTFTELIKDWVKSKNGFRIVIDPAVIYRFRDSHGVIKEDDKPNDEAINNLLNLGYRHAGFNNYLETTQVRWCFLSKLEGSHEDKKKEYSKSTRKNIETAYNKGLRIREGNEDDLDSMEYIFDETSKRKNFNVSSISYWKKYMKALGKLATLYIAYIDPDIYLNSTKELLENEKKLNKEILYKLDKYNVGPKLLKQKETSDNHIKKYEDELKVAETFKKDNPNGKTIAGLIAIRSGNEFLTLSSGSLSEYFSFYPKYLMYDQVVKDAYEEGLKYVNFYGIMGNFEKKNNPYYGIYEIKKGFSGEVTEYIGEFSLGVTSLNNLYDLLSGIKRILKNSK